MDFEEILRHLGSFGPLQKRLFALNCISAFFVAVGVVQDTFVAYENPYRCFVPCCDTNHNNYTQYFLNFTTPPGDENDWAECEMYSTRNSSYYSLLRETANCTEGCVADAFDSSLPPVGCNSWVYDTTLFKSSILTEFDLTCDRNNLRPLSTSCYMLGMFFGAFAFGHLADIFGRLTIFLLAITIYTGGATMCAIAPNLPFYLFFRVITGMGGVGGFETMFVISMEYMTVDWRTFAGVMINIPFALGESWTGVLAIFIREWRTLQLVAVTPSIVLLSYFWFVPESFRWLASVGKKEKAERVLQRVCDINGVEFPKHLFDVQQSTDRQVNEEKGKFPPDTTKSSTAKLTEERPGNFLDLFRTPTIRERTLILIYSWMATTFVYYGLASNSGNLAGNIFVNFILLMWIEIPSDVCAYYSLDIIGRKGTLVLWYLFGGVACIVSGFLPESVDWLIITLSLAGKFGIAASFATIYLYSAEVFPTQMRTVGIGTCSTFARLASIASPFITLLGDVYSPLPMLIFGLVSIGAGLLALRLPETYNCELPQTVDESECFGRDQSLLYFSCFHKNKDDIDEENSSQN